MVPEIREFVAIAEWSVANAPNDGKLGLLLGNDLVESGHEKTILQVTFHALAQRDDIGRRSAVEFVLAPEGLFTVGGVCDVGRGADHFSSVPRKGNVALDLCADKEVDLLALLLSGPEDLNGAVGEFFAFFENNGFVHVVDATLGIGRGGVRQEGKGKGEEKRDGEGFGAHR